LKALNGKEPTNKTLKNHPKASYRNQEGFAVVALEDAEALIGMPWLVAFVIVVV
jgi:hypothetical protein